MKWLKKRKRKIRLPSNWRDKIEITKFCTGRGETDFDINFKKGQTPKGFHRKIGQLSVNTDYPHYCEPVIDEYFCKRGLGTLLYTRALNHFGSLTTDYHGTSRAARGLWRSLIKKHYYETDFFKCELTIFSNKERNK